MACERCQDLNVEHRISVPADLTKAIAVVRDHVQDGTLREMEAPRSNIGEVEPFSKVPAEGPWDDVMSFAFACQSCGQRFTLTAETYHGTGGRWAPE